jgi:hypothetical protein
METVAPPHGNEQQPPHRIIPSPSLLLAAANAFVGLDELSSGDERTAVPELVLRQLGQHIADHWDTAILHHWGYWSHFDHYTDRSAWPVIAASTPGELADFGTAHGVLRTHPLEGDIFLQFGPACRAFVRAGVVARVLSHGQVSDSKPYFDVLTIEGNTGDDGTLGGARALRIVRRLSPAAGDRFLRWAELEGDHALHDRA